MDKVMDITSPLPNLNAAEITIRRSTEDHLYTQQSQETDDYEIQTKNYPYTPASIKILTKKDLSPIDLRTMKSLVTIHSPKDNEPSNKQKNEVTNITQVMESFYWADSCPNQNLSCKLFLTASTAMSLKPNPNPENNEICQENCAYSDAIDFSLTQMYSKKSDSNETPELTNQTNRDMATNTDQISVVSQGSQTAETEKKFFWAQTDFKPKNRKETILNYICNICQQLWPNKISYSRHLKTHMKNTNRKSIMKVQLSAGSKLQVTRNGPGTSRKQEQRPKFYLQLQPPSVGCEFECELCEERFPTETEKKEHRCIYPPIPMIKCPECPIQFYSQSGLNEHIGLIHKRENANSSYYCIFCNECFEAGYNFHMHLDNHLSQEKC